LQHFCKRELVPVCPCKTFANGNWSKILIGLSARELGSLLVLKRDNAAAMRLVVLLKMAFYQNTAAMRLLFFCNHAAAYLTF